MSESSQNLPTRSAFDPPPSNQANSGTASQPNPDPDGCAQGKLHWAIYAGLVLSQPGDLYDWTSSPGSVRLHPATNGYFFRHRENYTPNTVFSRKYVAGHRVGVIPSHALDNLKNSAKAITPASGGNCQDWVVLTLRTSGKFKWVEQQRFETLLNYFPSEYKQGNDVAVSLNGRVWDANAWIPPRFAAAGATNSAASSSSGSRMQPSSMPSQAEPSTRHSSNMDNTRYGTGSSALQSAPAGNSASRYASDPFPPPSAEDVRLLTTLANSPVPRQAQILARLSECQRARVLFYLQKGKAYYS